MPGSLGTVQEFRSLQKTVLGNQLLCWVPSGVMHPVTELDKAAELRTEEDI